MNHITKNVNQRIIQPILALVVMIFFSMTTIAQVNEQTTIDYMSGLGIGIGKSFDLIQGSGLPRIPITNTEHGAYPGGQLQNIGELLYIRNSLRPGTGV